MVSEEITASGQARLLAKLRRELDPHLTPHPSVEAVRSACRRLGRLPSDLRPAIWRLLLLGERTGREDVLELELKNVHLDLPNQRVVEVDAQRTRPEIRYFKTGAVQQRIQRLLTYHCKEAQIGYKQGLNEILAPFAALGNESLPGALSEVTIFRCFQSFWQQCLRNLYIDEEFRPMQAMMGLFRLLLQYHSPVLAAHLACCGLSPELYVSPWFLTAFARTLDLETTFEVWDYVLVHSDPVLPTFMLLSLLRQHEDELVQLKADSLPEYLTKLTFTTTQVEALITEAKQIRRETPRSACQRLEELCMGDLDLTSLPEFMSDLEDSLCLLLTPAEALQGVLDTLHLLQPMQEDDHEQIDEEQEGEERGREEDRVVAVVEGEGSGATGETDTELQQSDSEVGSLTPSRERDDEEDWPQRQHVEGGEQMRHGRGGDEGDGMSSRHGRDCKRRRDRGGRVSYLFCDTRTLKSFEAFRLESSLFLDEALLSEGRDSELDAFLEAIKNWRGLPHICIVSDADRPSISDHTSTAARYIRLCLSRGFRHVSFMEGGIRAFVQLLEEQMSHIPAHDTDVRNRLEQVLVLDSSLRRKKRSRLFTRLFGREPTALLGRRKKPGYSRHSDPGLLRRTSSDEVRRSPNLRSGSLASRTTGAACAGVVRGTSDGHGDDMTSSGSIDGACDRMNADERARAMVCATTRSSFSSSGSDTDSEEDDDQRIRIIRRKSSSQGSILRVLGRSTLSFGSSSSAVGDDKDNRRLSELVTQKGGVSVSPFNTMFARRGSSKGLDPITTAAESNPNNGQHPIGPLPLKAVSVSDPGIGIRTPWWTFGSVRSDSRCSASPHDAHDAGDPAHALPRTDGAPPAITATAATNHEARNSPASAGEATSAAASLSAAHDGLGLAPEPQPQPSEPAPASPSASSSRPSSLSFTQANRLAGIFSRLIAASPVPSMLLQPAGGRRPSDARSEDGGGLRPHGALESATTAHAQPCVSLEEWEGGDREGGHRFAVHRKLASGRLSPAVLCLAGRRAMVGVEVDGRPGYVMKVEERDIATLARVTRKKGVENNLKLHFEGVDGGVGEAMIELYCTESKQVISVLEQMVFAARSLDEEPAT